MGEEGTTHGPCFGRGASASSFHMPQLPHTARAEDLNPSQCPRVSCTQLSCVSPACVVQRKGVKGSRLWVTAGGLPSWTFGDPSFDCPGLPATAGA